MRIAAAYIRVSTMEQAEYSPESQLKAVREYAKRSGLRLPEEFVFVDEGLSGRSAQRRPAFQRMIALAKSRPRPFDVILLWKYSRFARSREDSVVYKALLRRECGVQVVSVSEPVGGDKMSVLIEAVIEAMDEYYSLNLAEEVRRGMGEKRARGEPVSAPPLGYRMERGRFVPDPEGAGTVRLIYQMFLAGESAALIARRLGAMGLRTGRGNPFETRAVLYILRNPVYTGRMGELPAHEAIVTQEEFACVQERLGRQARRYRHAEGPREDGVLRGLVRCSSCGGALVRSGRGMQCAAYAKGRCAVSHSITCEALERRVWEVVKRDFGEGQVVVRAGGRRLERAEERQRQCAAKKLERLRLAYEDGVISLEEFAGRRKELERGLEREEPSGEETAGLASLLADPARDAGLRGRVLRAFVERIVFDRERNRVLVYYFI